jgi:SAM-dependent MidA family methyltransferase
MPNAKTIQPSLGERLAARIAASGPISVEDYMQACLLDARAGAYAANQPIGAAGHFVTAPEISQIFGELIGLWAVSVWHQMGEPASVTIAELGPGRGTLLSDALRAWRGFPNFLKAANLALIEASPVLAETQRTTLAASAVKLHWYPDIAEVPVGPLIVLANEFIDALPVRQYVRRGGTWTERMIGVGPRGGFVFVDGPPAAFVLEADDGAILETRPAATRLLRNVADRAAAVAVLIVDYGHEEPGFGDTLQAVRGHAHADPLAAPGEADLSAHVDFAALKREAEGFGLNAYGPMPQGQFLLELGLGERREQLLAKAAPHQRDTIASGALRLADPAQMGVLFKVLAMTSAGLPPPPPFA